MTTGFSDYQILIVPDKKLTGLKPFLLARGFEVLTPENVTEGLKLALDRKPHIVIMNLLGEKLNACEFCKKLFQLAPNIPTKVLVVSHLRDKANVLSAIQSGASDYILIPFDNDRILERVKYHLRKIKVIDSTTMVEVLHDERIEVIFGVLDVLAKGLNPHETLYNIAFRTEKIVSVERCNIIAGGQFTDVGFVTASNDDPEFQGFKLDLHKYPEVQQVLHTGKTVVVEDIRKDPIMREIKKNLKNISFNSMLVAPITYKTEVIGVISVRSKEETRNFTEEEIKICQLLGVAAAPALYMWRAMNKDLIQQAKQP